MATTIHLLLKYLEKDNVTALSNLLQPPLDSNFIFPTFHCRPHVSARRTKVPILSAAVAHNALDCIDFLLKSGADVDLQDDRGWTPVHWAAQIGRSDALSRVLAAKAKPSPDSIEAAPLLLAARAGQVKCMELLLEHGARVDQQDGSGRTALHLVSWFGHRDAVPVLLAHKANTEIEDETVHTPLHYAAWFNQVEICRLLIKAHAGLNVKDHSLKTPLHFAVQHYRPDVVRLLLDEGADWRMKDSDGKSPEGIAIAEGFTDILDILTGFAKKSEATEPTTVLDELIEEHRTIRANVETLAAARDRFLEPFLHVGSRIEGINNQIQRLGEQQRELMESVERLRAVLKEIITLVNAPEPPRAEEPRPEPKPEQPRVLMCRLCGQNQSAWRCKACHSTFCNKCWQKMKPGKCPICKPEAKA